jgi:hypothetical protein
MRQQLDWLDRNAHQYTAFQLQAWTAALAGQLRQVRGFSRRAMEFAMQRNLKDKAGSAVAERMLNDASYGLCQQVNQDAARARALSQVGYVAADFSIPVLPGVALALALCGEVSEAQKLAEELAQLSERYAGNRGLPAGDPRRARTPPRPGRPSGAALGSGDAVRGEPGSGRPTCGDKPTCG